MARGRSLEALGARRAQADQAPVALTAGAMATTGAGTYEERIAKFGVASLEEVAAAAAKPNAVFLDIRSRTRSMIPLACQPPHPRSCSTPPWP